MRPPIAASIPFPRPGSLLPLAAAGIATFFALLVGMATVIAPAKAVAFAAFAAFGPITLVSFPLGLALWAATLSLSNVVGIALASSVGGIGLIFVWFGVIAGRRDGLKPVIARVGPSLAPAIGLVLWLGLSYAWSDDPALVSENLLYWALAVVLLAMVATTLETVDQVRLVASGFVIGAVLSVLSGLISGDLFASTSAIQTAQAAEGRFTSAGNDPNELAAGLVGAIAIAVGMLAGARGPHRLGLCFGIVVMVGGAAATQSRGGLVAAACCVVAAIVLASGHRLQALGLATLVGVVAMFFLASTPGALDRITTFDNGGNGRSELWSIAYSMWEDHPVTGVGLNQYRVESAAYVRDQRSLKFVNLIAESPHIVHNTYLQILAENGIIGLLLFLATAGLALLTSWRAAAAFVALGRPDVQALAQGVLIGQIGMLVAAFFLSIGSDFRLWLLFGMGPALLACSRTIGQDALTNRPAR